MSIRTCVRMYTVCTYVNTYVQLITQVKPPCTYLQDTCKKNKKCARSARIQFCKICRKILARKYTISCRGFCILAR